MKRSSIVSFALMALVGSAVGSYAAWNETFTGAAAASGTYRRPQLLVDGKRYELKASDKAGASVAEVLAGFPKGDAGTYVVEGTRGTVNGADGILRAHGSLSTRLLHEYGHGPNVTLTFAQTAAQASPGRSVE